MAASVYARRLTVDSAFNLGAVVVLGVCGLLLNFVIARVYSPEALGVFNQVFAVYIFLSQVGVWGVNLAVLKFLPEHHDEPRTHDVILWSGLCWVVVTATLSVGLLLASRDLIAQAVASPAVARGLLLVAPGLWCFSVNKVLLNVLNGQQRMVSFAVCTALRYLLLIGALGVLVWRDAPGRSLSLVFSIAEGVLLVGLMGYLVVACGIRPARPEGVWLRRIWRFSLRSLLGGVMVELNTRVDVLMLGLWASDHVVGIYSFAAILVEGLTQLPLAFRRIFDPKLTISITAGRLDEVERFVRRTRWLLLGGMAVIGGVTTLIFPYLATMVAPGQGYEAGWLVFAILAAGAVGQSGYIPFSGILTQGGFPGRNTILLTLAMVTNLVLNAALIPLYGMVGAAVATALSYLLFVVYLIRMSRSALGVRL